MIDFIKTIEHGVLPETVLGRLGRVNVVCGKNNSGKSTVLESLASVKRSEVALVPNSKLKDLLMDAYNGIALAPRYTGGTPGSDTVRHHFEKALEMTLNDFPYIFTSDLSRFYQRLNAHFVNVYQRDHYQVRTDGISVSLTSLLKNLGPERVLLPPKRAAQSTESITAEKPVQSDGSWLLNELFFCKNQSESSPELLLYEKVQNVFEQVSSGYTFDIIQRLAGGNSEPGSFSLQLTFKGRGRSEWVEAADCGLGLRELLVIVYFALEPKRQLILLEEPENHMHPEMQRRLLRFLREETEKQYFISTHSNIFLNTTYVDRVFHATFGTDNKIRVGDATPRTELLNELGYSVADNLVSDLIILVEGPKDTPVIEEFLKKFEIDADFNVKIWALGGDIMSQLDLSVFKERYKVIALVDKDPKSDKVRKEFIKKCKELEIPVTRLKRYALENYFSLNALRKVFKAQIPSHLTEIDPERTLEEQIGINVKRNNRKLAQAMSVEEIAGTDLERFFIKVSEVCKAG